MGGGWRKDKVPLLSLDRDAIWSTFSSQASPPLPPLPCIPFFFYLPGKEEEENSLLVSFSLAMKLASVPPSFLFSFFFPLDIDREEIV